jgi:hypothetical protein
LEYVEAEAGVWIEGMSISPTSRSQELERSLYIYLDVSRYPRKEHLCPQSSSRRLSKGDDVSMVRSCDVEIISVRLIVYRN